MKPDLSQLHDIHLPQTSLWWPPALGWWLLAALFLLLTALGIWWYRRRARQQWRKQALALLHSLPQQPAKAQIIALSQLLRRVALSRFPRHEVAALTGEAWLRFLDSQLRQPGFVQHGQILLTAPYNDMEPCADLSALFELSERWIREVA